ncbi:MAG TPA: prepilin-type N-terminal cleavage/methylation domain-containing protein [Elusimicrobiota bacterium]|nr:prepilin-type N-terminal cleavage/methylation domain-containing protein [Elusimicrobiota bacterium]
MKPPADPTKGFTLIELMIVVAIVGVLAAIALPKFADLVRKSKEAATKGTLGSVRSAISIYYANMEGTYPGDDLTCLTVDSKYLREIPAATVPGQHDTSPVVETNDTLGMAALLMMDNGRWKYWNWTMGAPAGQKTQGDFWIGCTHTETKGTVWSTI